MKKIYYYFALCLMLFSATALMAQPANDNCSGAQNLGTLPAPAACGSATTGTKNGTVVTVAGTNVGATPSNPYPYISSCAPGNLLAPPDDVWYSFVASSYQTKIAITAATFANPVITVWEGSCNNLAGIGCVVGTANAATLTVLALTPGNTYYVQVSGEDSTQTGTFTMKLTSQTDCANCLVASTTTASPPPVNGTYQPGTTVTFCDSIYNWDQTSENWLHGVVPTFGPGWNLSTLTVGAFPSSCSQDGGMWGWYPGGDTSSNNGSIWGAGFYYETTLGSTSGILDGNPGNNYGDNDASNLCSWKFCVTITTNSGACTPGVNLDVTFAVSGDGQSGSWTSIACQNDPITDIYIVGSCCPPTMSSTPATCANPNGGTATATPTGTYSPWTFQWSNGTTQTLSGPSTITGLSAGIDTVTVTDATNCTITAVVTVGGSGVNGGANQTVNCIPTLPGGTATMGATGTGAWTVGSGNPGTATITSSTSPTTTITNFTAAGIYRFVWTEGGCHDTVKVTVTTKPNAGPDQTLSCVTLPGGTVTMAGTGTGTWTAETGNPGTATITTPTSPTTTITNFTALGTYHFIWTNGSCTDTAAVTISSRPNAGPNETVTCATLPGGSATMAGTGTGTWTAQAGNPGTATITTPTSPTTTITTFSTAGTYNFIWTSGACSDTASVVVTAKPNAGPDQTISCVILPGGSATMAATGTGTWTAATGNPGTATITTPTSPTTTITTFTAAGTYKFVWTNGTCTDTANVTITAKPNAGPDQTVSCVTLPGGSATMAATGTGTWTAETGNPGTATITTPTSPTTTITTFSTAGTYKFIWTSGGCTDTADVIVTAKPNAGPDQTVSCIILPGGTATMAATGTGTWTAETGNPGTATITTPTSPTTTITTFSAAGTYNFIWTSGGCTDTAKVTVTAKPNAGPAQTVNCATLPGGSATMAATGTGTWTAETGNPGTATITTPTSPTTTITTFSTAGTYHFIWTSNGCADTTTVTVTAKPNGGANQTVSCIILPGGIATMAATGTGTWTAESGNPGTSTITTPSSPTTTITTFSAAGVYHYIWTNGSCADTVSVTVTAKPNAGPDQFVTCFPINSSATMAATGAGTWTAEAGNPGTATITTPTSPTTTITAFSAAGTYNFVWTSGGCTDTASVFVTTKPNAGPDQTVSCVNLPGGSATMAGTGTGTWTAETGNPGTATITNPTSPTTTITTFSIAGTYNFIWTNGSCSDTAAVTVTAKPNAGPDQTITCVILPGGSATMAATGTGTWTAQTGNPGTATITAPGSPTTTITTFSAPGTYKFIWTSGGCTDTADVIVTAKPNAGPDQTVSCATLPGGSATMGATGTGTWTAEAGNPGTSTITTPGSPTTTITTFSIAGTYYYIWTNGSCTDTVAVTVTAKPNAGPDQTVSCIILPGGSATMGATGTGTWTAEAGNPGTSTITTPGSPTTTITTFSAPGTYYYIWTSGSCTDTAKITVTAKPNAGPDQTVTCATLPGGSATMGASGTGTWTIQPGNPGTSTITSPGSATTTITTFSAPGTYYYIWTSGGCTDTAAVTVTAAPRPTVSSAGICPGDSATLVASGGVSYIWNTTATTDSITVFPVTTTTYTVTATNSSGCTATASGTVTVNPIPTPTVNSPSVCLGASATLTATGGVSYVWNTTATTTSITVSPSTTTTYTVTATNASGCTATASGTVTVNALPTPAVYDDTTICAGNPASLTASGGVSYIWSNTATTTTITVTPATTTTYTVTATNAAACTATASATVTVNALPTPAVNSPGICPTDSATLIATGGVSYVWNTTATTDSITVSPVSTTTYTVTVTNAAGCTATASGTVTVNSLPTPTVNSPSICFGNSATLTATGGVSYVWNTTATTASITVSPTTQTIYTVTATNAAGCTATASGTVTVNALPTPAVYDDTAICAGNSATLTASGGISYVWSNTATTTTITVTPATTTTYTVTATNAAACTAIASATVTVNPLPAPTVNSTNICPGDSAVLTATGGVSYVWNTTAATTSITVSPSTTTTYTVTATNAAGCTAIASGTVTVNPLPIPTVNNPSVCAGTPATLTATGGVSYVWSTTATTASITTTAAGTYYVTVTNALGCTAIDSGTVTIIPKPNAGPDTTICQNAIAGLNATGAGIWSALPSNPATTTIASPNSASTSITGFSGAGTYGYVWTVNGCTDTAYVYVNADPTLAPAVVNITCTNATGVVYANAGGTSPFTYSWSNASSADSITTTTSGTLYTVTVTDGNSCTASASDSVSNQIVTVSITDSLYDVTCYGYSNGKIILYVSPAGQYTYLWSNSGSADSITGLAPGTYSVSVSDAMGCSATASYVITSPSQDIVTISPYDTLITLGDTVQLNSTLTGAYPAISYLWVPSVGLSCTTCPDPVLIPVDTNKDLYVLYVTYNNDCSVTDSAFITAKANDLLGLPDAFTPNGDGKNDTFYIRATGVKDFKMNIYNRWGEEVFSTADINIGWDGTYKGNPEPSEAYMYFFTLVYLDGKTVTHEGTFMLLR